MAKYCWLLALLLCMCTLTVKAQEPVYNYYLIFVNGDTVTEGIKWVNLWFNDKHIRDCGLDYFHEWFVVYANGFYKNPVLFPARFRACRNLADPLVFLINQR